MCFKRTFISSCCSRFLKNQNNSNNRRKTCSDTYENSSDDHIYGLKTVIETFYRTIVKGTKGTKAPNIGITRENGKKKKIGQQVVKDERKYKRNLARDERE